MLEFCLLGVVWIVEHLRHWNRYYYDETKLSLLFSFKYHWWIIIRLSVIYRLIEVGLCCPKGKYLNRPPYTYKVVYFISLVWLEMNFSQYKIIFCIRDPRTKTIGPKTCVRESWPESSMNLVRLSLIIGLIKFICCGTIKDFHFGAEKVAPSSTILKTNLKIWGP